MEHGEIRASCIDELRDTVDLRLVGSDDANRVWTHVHRAGACLIVHESHQLLHERL